MLFIVTSCLLLVKVWGGFSFGSRRSSPGSTWRSPSHSTGRKGASCPLSPWRCLPADREFKDIERLRVVEEADDLDLLHQILFCRQLLEDTVLRSHPESRRPGQKPPSLPVLDPGDLHYDLSLPVHEFVEVVFVGLGLSYFIQATLGTDHRAAQLHRSSDLPAERTSASRHEPLRARGDASQQQDQSHSGFEGFAHRRHKIILD